MFCVLTSPQLLRRSQHLARPTRRREDGAQRKGREKAWPCEQTGPRWHLARTRESAARALSSENTTVDMATTSGTAGRRGTLLPVKGLSFGELVSFCREVLDEEHPEKRARQLWRWMYSDYRWVRSLEDAAAGMCWSS